METEKIKLLVVDNLSEIELENRVCIHEKCGVDFRVMKTDKQIACAGHNSEISAEMRNDYWEKRGIKPCQKQILVKNEEKVSAEKRFSTEIGTGKETKPSDSVSLIDDTSQHLFGLMRGLGKFNIKEALDNPKTYESERVKTAVMCAKEIRELMRLKLEAIKTARKFMKEGGESGRKGQTSDSKFNA